MQRPAPTEHIPYYERYISLVPGDDALKVLENQLREVRAFFAVIPEARGGDRYAPEKWSVREVLGHLIDVERILAYRALSIARGEAKSLTGFEPDDYAARSDADRYPMADLLAEFELMRRSHLAMMRRFSDEAWGRMGLADGNPISPRALAFIMAGHIPYHLKILREQYGVGV